MDKFFNVVCDGVYFNEVEIRNELQKSVDTNNSVANLVFKNIQTGQQDLLGIQSDFETEFKCSRDPRFVEFLNSLNTEKNQKANIFNYLFNALAIRGVQEIEGRRSFDLSTDHFNTCLLYTSDAADE